MPSYEYQCLKCKRIIEHICDISRRPEMVTCPVCTCTAQRIVSNFAAHDDHPKWLTPRLCETIQDDSDKPIECKSDLNAFCKDRGIVENPKSA